MHGRPRRSVLYMPGSNERALEKAKTIPADALIFDLEDAVAPDAKAPARDQVCAAVRNGGYGGREIVIRVNGLETPWVAVGAGFWYAAAVSSWSSLAGEALSSKLLWPKDAINSGLNGLAEAVEPAMLVFRECCMP